MVLCPAHHCIPFDGPCRLSRVGWWQHIGPAAERLDSGQQLVQHVNKVKFRLLHLIC